MKKKRKRYRLRKKYRDRLKKLGKFLFVLLLLFATVKIGILGYQIMIEKKETQEVTKQPSKTKEESTLTSDNKPVDIIIDAGHGGRDPGCEWDEIMEKHITLDISRQVAQKLERQGYHVYMTRTDDRDFSDIEDYDLMERVNIGEQINPKLFVSIHVNFSEYEEATGCEVFYDGDKVFAAHAAKTISDNMHDSNVLPSRGASETLPSAPIYIVDYNSCETVLIETAFLSNETDRNILANSFKRVEIANVIADGIHQSFTTYE